jgi:hypothetical protein
MSNFTFIQADFPALHADAVEAEQLTSPLFHPKLQPYFAVAL